MEFGGGAFTGSRGRALVIDSGAKTPKAGYFSFAYLTVNVALPAICTLTF